MTPQQFADRVMLDENMWTTFLRRCEVIAAAHVYGHKHASTVAVAALRGMSLGLGFLTSLEVVQVIHGRPQVRGPSAVALIRARMPEAKLVCVTPDADKGTRAVWIMARPGGAEQEFVATIEGAKAAGLLKSPSWQKYPDRMLKWWAASIGCQELFGDVLMIAIHEDGEGEPSPPEDVPAVEVAEIVEVAEVGADAEEPQGEIVYMQADPLTAASTEAHQVGDEIAAGRAVECKCGTLVRAKSLTTDTGYRVMLEARKGETPWTSIWYSTACVTADDCKAAARYIGAIAWDRGPAYIEAQAGGG